jgi:hypothetical protein
VVLVAPAPGLFAVGQIIVSFVAGKNTGNSCRETGKDEESKGHAKVAGPVHASTTGIARDQDGLATACCYETIV